MRVEKKGFTLVEILIVVVILGILAAIVIPQFSDASTEARVSSLTSDLQTVRSQIELYKIQHSDALPGSQGVVFETCMTTWTDIFGAVQTGPGDNIYGPYMRVMPTNPFNNSFDVTSGTITPPGSTTVGWYFNTTTGAFNANDPNATHRAY